MEELEAQRIQVIGRSLLSHIQQCFRNADLFDANNQIFQRLSTTLANYISESFKVLGGCSLRIGQHQVFLEDHRVFVDSGMMESVNFMNDLFEKSEIGGLMFQHECTQAGIIIKSLFAFRETIGDDNARGVEAIKNGMTRRHVPYLTPISSVGSQITMTGIRDSENAKKFAQRNAGKLVLFLQDFVRSVEQEEKMNMNVIYRIIMNLMRISEKFPQLIQSLIYYPISQPLVRQLFQGIILTLQFGSLMKLDRRVQIDISVATIFQKFGYLTVPEVVRQSPKMREYAKQASERGAKKILEAKFVNRALFHRLVVAYQAPFQKNVLYKPEEMTPFVKLIRTIIHLVNQWNPAGEKGMILPEAIHKLIHAQDPTLDKPFLIVIAYMLGLFHPGQTLISDKGSPLVVETCPVDGSDPLTVKGFVRDPLTGYESHKYNLRDELQLETAIRSLNYVKPGPERPNAIRVLL